MRRVPATRLASWCLLAGLVSVGVLLICCGNNGQLGAGTGSITTILSDPPSCAAPGGPFQNAWVTVTKVTANISATASDTDSGWVTLVDLTGNPVQIDLLSLASTTCVLTRLGSSSGLPPGNYQQIRFYLLANNASSGPSPNHCGSGNGFNCVVPTGGTPQELLLSSEAQTGIKIPPGQISGGGVSIVAGQSADLVIDFDACSSIVPLGNGQYRLKPTLHAGQVSVTGNSISGSVVDSVSKNPIPGASVLLEQVDSTGIDRVVRAGTSASDGTFIFCPLPSGNYDVVVAAQTTSTSLVTTTYNATVAFNVPLGTALSNIPLAAEIPPPAASAAATITGQVTTTGSSGATVADIALSALQQATPTGGTTVQVTVPVFAVSSEPPVVTTTATPTPAAPSCPTSNDCFNYSLQVPASNPLVGTFANGSISYAVQASGSVNYSVNGSTSNCTASVPSSGTIGPVAVSGGATTPVPTALVFTGCTAP